ncbi:hypothetical protein PV327_000179 [Microctonus hyperodae]|uniref:CLIP domain-containing serine protease n=1 Tax=Microctonus hyperodae TaxID=165561 RepID=A0AA39L1V8_MICHY|nr:hypothetical protein PV327_000179 [Microctonus hyperodae]
MLKTQTFIKFFIIHILLFGSLNAQSWVNDDNCVTPNNVSGLCINIRQCPPLLQILVNRPMTPEGVQFLRNSQCGFEGNDPKVCCPIVNNQTPSTTSEEPNQPGPRNTNINLENPLLPDDCGRDISLRIVGGERADIDEFPWMVLLEYQKPNGRTTACGGVLISKRYVLTAAHCIKGKDLPKTWRLIGVRLGEYDTSTETDCIPDGDDSQICAPPPVSIGVDEQIAHENYHPASRDQKNDIALLRLSRDVTFTAFIKPICLPNNGEVAQKLWVAGWGKTESRSESNIKLKLSIPLADRNECQARYGNAAVNLGLGQICVGGQRGKDSCRGDSGGPLMSVERTSDGTGKWTAIGVVSFGPSPCGMQGWPGVYTKVSDFTDWILTKMRA